MKRWWSLTFVFVGLLFFVLTGCSSNNSSSSQQTTSNNQSAPSEQNSSDASSSDGEGEIVVGILLPMTGANAPDGQDMYNGAVFAVEEINENGGVLGKKIKLVVEDDACDPQMATSAANKLVANQVTAVVGGYCSGATLPATGVFNKAGMPLIIPAANSSRLSEQGFNNIFMINGMVPDQAKKAVDYFMNENAQNIAVIHDNTAYARDLADFAKQFVEEAGGQVIAFEAINPEEKDFGAIMTKMNSLNPDAIYFTGYYSAGGLMVRQFKQKNVSGLFMGGDGSFHETIIEIAGSENAEGILISATPTAEFLPGADTFVEEYRGVYNIPPGPYTALTYNAMLLLADSIERANSTESEEITKALADTEDFEALGMTINFNEDGTLKTNNFGILRVESGKFNLVY